MPAISVIVPVYNGEQFIHKCIDSILSQTFDDFELIIVDDGSSDNCAKICDEYAEKDSRVVVVHGTNKGVSIARNIGLAVATGEYVAFCDGDDYFKENLLERTYKTAVKNHSDVVSFNLQRMSETGTETENEQKEPEIIDLNDENRFDFLYKVVTWQTKGWQACRSIFRRQIIEENHILFCDTCNNFAEDLGFTLEHLLYAARIIFIDEYLYYYYDVRQDSMMNISKKVYKVNEVNELSYYLKPRIQAVLPNTPYCVLHHHMIMNQVVDLYSVKTKQEFREWDAIIKKIDKLDYFKEQNKDYDSYYKKQKNSHGLRRFLFRNGIIHSYLYHLSVTRLTADLRKNRLFSVLLSAKRNEK